MVKHFVFVPGSRLPDNSIRACSPRLLFTLPGDGWPVQEVHLLPRTPFKLPAARTPLLLYWLAGLQTSQSKSPDRLFCQWTFFTVLLDITTYINIHTHTGSTEEYKTVCTDLTEKAPLFTECNVLPSLSTPVVPSCLHHHLTIHVCEHVPDYPTRTKELEDLLKYCFMWTNRM